MSFAADWDAFGRVVMAVGFLAFLLYLAPSALPIAPQWARWFEIATLV